MEPERFSRPAVEVDADLMRDAISMYSEVIESQGGADLMRDAIKDAHGPHSDALKETIGETISGTHGHPWPSVASSSTQWHSAF